DIPTIHRIRFADLDGDGKAELIAVPLMGRNSTAKNNWMDGEPVKIQAFGIPKDPMKDRWVSEVVNTHLHVVHNFFPFSVTTQPADGGLFTASYDGVTFLVRHQGVWAPAQVASANQDKP